MVFELTTEPAANFGTPGSARGFTFDVVQSTNVNLVVDAVYRNEVSVGANPFVGDPYTTLEFNFAGFGLSANMQFGADTDLIAAGAVIGPSVPEPASVVLMAAAVALLGLRRFRPPQRLRVFRACPSSARKGVRSRRKAQL